MKVLFIVNIPSPYRVDFFNELGKVCDLTVVFERSIASNRDSEWFTGNHKNFKYTYMKGIKVNQETAFCPSIIKWINKKYDVIVLGGYSTPTGILASLYLKLKKKPYILNVDGGLIKNDNKVKFMLKKLFIGSASAWLSTGENTSKYLVHYGANPEKVHNYSFTSIYKSDIISKPLSNDEKHWIREKLGINEKKMILSIGRFIEIKGFDVLLNSFKTLDDQAGLYIIGGEPNEEYLTIVEELDLKNVHFLPFKNKQELFEFYKASDLFVLPTRGDVWGLVINEAMANGLPVITTDKCNAGLELIENDHNGYIVEVNNANQLNSKITNIINGETKKSMMASNSLIKINAYTLEKMAIEHIEIFNKFIKGNFEGNYVK